MYVIIQDSFNINVLWNSATIHEKKINALELEPLKREYDESCSVMKRPSNKILRLQKSLLCNVSAQWSKNILNCKVYFSLRPLKPSSFRLALANKKPNGILFLDMNTLQNLTGFLLCDFVGHFFVANG